LIHMFTDR